MHDCTPYSAFVTYPARVTVIDKPRIAAAALAVADERGAQGFTMRAVAEALGVTPMALYHHVQNKADLVALVVDEVIGEHPLPPCTDSWEDDIVAMARWLRRMVHEHPGVGQLRRSHPVWTPAMLPLTERWFAVWQRAGLERSDAVLGATLSSLAIIGVVETTLLFNDMEPPQEVLLETAPRARSAFEATHDREAEFELLVRSILEGLHARLLIRPSDACSAEGRACG